MEAAVQQALQKHFPGVSGLIANYDSPNFYLSEEAMSAKGLKRLRLNLSSSKPCRRQACSNLFIRMPIF